MATLYAEVAVLWVKSLSDVVAALEKAEDLPGIDSDDRLKFWKAKIEASVVLDSVLRLTCSNVAVEPAAILERAA